MLDTPPIEVMKAFYRKVNPVHVAFRQKNSDDREWYLCEKPIWNFGVCDYKIINLDTDDFRLM